MNFRNSNWTFQRLSKSLDFYIRNHLEKYNATVFPRFFIRDLLRLIIISVQSHFFFIIQYSVLKNTEIVKSFNEGALPLPPVKNCSTIWGQASMSWLLSRYNVFHQFRQAKFVLWWFEFKLGAIFATVPASSKNDACYKSGQNWLEIVNYATLI